MEVDAGKLLEEASTIRGKTGRRRQHQDAVRVACEDIWSPVSRYLSRLHQSCGKVARVVLPERRLLEGRPGLATSGLRLREPAACHVQEVGSQTGRYSTDSRDDCQKAQT